MSDMQSLFVQLDNTAQIAYDAYERLQADPGFPSWPHGARQGSLVVGSLAIFQDGDAGVVVHSDDPGSLRLLTSGQARRRGLRAPVTATVTLMSAPVHSRTP